MKKVLVIEDDKIWMEILKKIVTNLGNEVVTARDGFEGLWLALKERPDVLIIDHVLPRVNGAHIARFLRNDPDFRYTGIAIITFHEDMMNEYWAKEFGADMFLRKQDGIDAVSKALEEFLSRDFKTFGRTKSSEINVSLESILTILDEELRHEKINRDVLSLVEFIEDEDYIIKKVWDTVNDFADIGGMYLLLLTPAIGRIYAFSNDRNVINPSKLKDVLFSNMTKPLTPSSWSFKGNVKFEDDGEVPDFQLSFSLEFHKSELGTVGFENVSMDGRKVIFSLFKDLYDSFGVLVHTLNVFWENKIASTIDSLTGLYVKKVIIDKLRELRGLGARKKLVFSIVMMDIDDFKKVNDTYGHVTGDNVLRNVGNLIRSSIRETDYAGRYGGEEFLIILPGTDVEGAKVLVGRLLEKVRSTDWKSVANVDGVVTMSAGIAPGDPKLSVTEMVEMADRALYEAKRSGKDRYAVYGGD